MHIYKLEMSTHAGKRINQKGSKKSFVEFVLNEVDTSQYAGGVYKSFISKKKLKTLVSDKILSAGESSHIKNVVVVECEDTILTVYHKTKKCDGIKLIW